MKKVIVFVLSLMMTMVVKAGDVTPEQALQQAKDFLQEQVAVGVRTNRSQLVTSELKLTGRVSGLYVFNADGDNGYVIVSNDDRTTPVLGYADNGKFDADNMPENMRAWLQGYADEIAWLNTHDIQPAAQTARRTSAVKTPIAPLVQTLWDQGNPYNLLCPDFFTYGKCVTGCVATAMAQVMYYTATKAGLASSATIANIDAYDCNTNWGGLGKVHVEAVPAGTELYWDQMLLTYKKNGADPDEAKTAVATLMQACGASVGTNYANSASGGSSAAGAICNQALITYFGYEASTTQSVDRSFYSYANWIEMLYNELNQGRAIIYGGQSSGGGHEFVCDGYQGEDYFHINWGWSGGSNGFFKLSALNPDEQGIGGSTSTDGYHYGQHAIVGIQLEGGTGTVVSHPNFTDPNSIALTINSVTADKTNITVNETATITFNITNSNSVAYDGEIGLFIINNNTTTGGKMFLIPAGQTKDCVFEFKPKYSGTHHITAYIPRGNGSYGPFNYDKQVDIDVESAMMPTDDVELTLETPTVENAELYKNTTYYLYGNVFRATVRIVNNSTEDDYSGKLLWKLLPQSFVGNYTYDEKKIYVPKNSYIDVPLEVDGLNTDENYYSLDINYTFKGSRQGDQWYYYVLKPSITTYAADGTVTVTKTSATNYDAPADILAVELVGTAVTTVSGGATNCVFISDKTLSGATNIIKKTGSTYTAANIVLVDGHDFFTPVGFTAENIEFTYDNDRWADGSNGWNTIMLPFDVTTVTANDTPIDWFHGDSDSGKQFWLKEFVGDNSYSPKVEFDYVAGSMKANTPYIIALPGSAFGDAYNLNGKTIKFIGTNSEVSKSEHASITGGNYRFVGDTRAVSTEDIYCINAAGNQFVLKSTGGSPAFRPFFKAEMFDRTVNSLSIGGGGDTTGINDVRSETEEVRGGLFDLQGRRVEKPGKGLYIVNGKKVVIK